MIKRREFLKAAGQTTALLLARPLLRAQNAGAENASFRWNSEHIEVELSRSAPELLSLNIDGLGQGQRGANILNADRNIGGYQASVVTGGQTLRVEYRTATAAKDSPAGWTFECSPSKIVLTTEWSADFVAPRMVLPFQSESGSLDSTRPLLARRPSGHASSPAFSRSGLHAAYGQ